MPTPCFILLLLCLCASTTLAASSTGFRVQLTRVDAGTRIPRRLELVSGVTAPVMSLDSGQYVAMFAIGSPPQATQAVMSTSRGVVSMQCLDCSGPRSCFGYDYKKSSTGQPVRCGDSMCPNRCSSAAADRPCRVHDVHGVPGVIRADEFHFDFGTAASRVNVTFGCMGQASDDGGDLYGGASGLLGLGRGASSLVSQLGSRRFSYCLTRLGDRLDYSTLLVGSNAGLSGDAPVTSTPLFRSPYAGVFSSSYFLSMSGMSLGEGALDIPRDAFRGGVVMDSEFLYISLVDAAYVALKKEMARQLGRSLVPPPEGLGLELCMAEGDVSLLMEPLVLHLGGGADLAVPMDNLWLPADVGTACMAVVSSDRMTNPWNQITVLGSFMQQGLHVLFDLETETVSFQPANCGTL